MGDLESAEDALRRAHALGRTPHPALALLRLKEGNLKAAVSAINTAVADLAWDRWTTARLLPAIFAAVLFGPLAAMAVFGASALFISFPLAGRVWHVGRRRFRGRAMAGA